MPSTKPAVEGVSALDLARNTLEQVLKIKSTGGCSPSIPHAETACYNAWRIIVDQTPMPEEAKQHYLLLVEWLYGGYRHSRPFRSSQASDGYCASKWAGAL